MEEAKKEIELLEKAISLLHKCKNWTAEDDDENYYMQERLSLLRLKMQEPAAASSSGD